jgi:hypothetical protein
MKSKYKIGWIGIRVGKLLEGYGWMRLDPASPNNRDGFDWAMPSQTRNGFLETDWRKLARQVTGTLERLAELRKLRPAPTPREVMGNVERARLGGVSKSPAKGAASRKNGLKGGRNQI